jgi:hypothetical protein
VEEETRKKEKLRTISLFRCLEQYTALVKREKNPCSIEA